MRWFFIVVAGTVWIPELRVLAEMYKHGRVELLIVQHGKVPKEMRMVQKVLMTASWEVSTAARVQREVCGFIRKA